MENQNTDPTLPVSADSQTQQAPPPVSNPKKKLPIALIIGVLIFLVLAAGASGFFLFQKSQTKPAPIAQNQTPTQPPVGGPTTIWKMYTNLNYGFWFKYPSDWVENPQGEGCCVSVYPQGAKYPDKTFTAEADSEENSKIGQCTSDIAAAKGYNLNESQTQINGYQATVFEGNSTYEGKMYYRKYVLVASPTHCIRLNSNSSDSNYRKIFDQILSTFTFAPLSASKFTPASPAGGDSQTIDTSNWKTYNSELYSIKVPAEWYRDGDKTFQNYNPRTAPGRGFDPSSDKGKLKIEIVVFKTNLALGEFLDKSTEEGQTGLLYTPENPKKLTVSGQPAIIDGSSVFVKDPKNTAAFLVSFGLDFEHYKELRDQILSTFTFN